MEDVLENPSQRKIYLAWSIFRVDEAGCRLVLSTSSSSNCYLNYSRGCITNATHLKQLENKYKKEKETQHFSEANQFSLCSSAR